MHHTPVKHQMPMKEQKLSLADAIRQIRFRMRLSQRKFGERIGVLHTNVSRYERGKTVPSNAVLINLSRYANEQELTPVMSALGVGDESLPSEFQDLINLTLDSLLAVTDGAMAEQREGGVSEALKVECMVRSGQLFAKSLEWLDPKPYVREDLLDVVSLIMGQTRDLRARFPTPWDNIQPVGQEPIKEQDEFLQLAREFNELVDDDFQKRMVKSGMKDAIKIARMRQEEAAEQDEESKAG